MPEEQTSEPPTATTGGGGSGGGSGDSQRSIPTPFLTKTYQLVDDQSVDELISWNEDGSTFIVWRPAEFARDLLPKYFKHNNFSSFVRQLNTYGFRKIVQDRWEFANDCFKKGEKALLRDIQRRKISQPPPSPASGAASAVTIAAVPAVPHTVSPSNSGEDQAISSNSSPAAVAALHRTPSCMTTPELMEENEKLRKENVELNQELAQLKGLCNNVLSLLTNYASGQKAGRQIASEEKPLELFLTGRAAPTVECPADDAGDMKPKLAPRLFGVPIGKKRPRGAEEYGGEGSGEEERREDHKNGSDVKSEPLDENSWDRQDRQWLELGKK